MFRILPLLILPALLTGCSEDKPEKPETIVLQGETMGTTYSIKLNRLPENIDQETLQKEIDQILEEVNNQMSTYRPNSELSRFNSSTSTDWFPVSEAVIQVVQKSKELFDSTHGAFDPTVAPLVNLWNFGPGRTQPRIPEDPEILAALGRLGFPEIHIQENPPALKKDRAGITLDLSAIAKGYGVDAVAEELDQRGVADYMAEIGGEVRTKGTNLEGEPWKIGINRPSPGENVLQEVVSLSGQSMATSGDYRNFFMQDGKRYSHEIDPRTGRPIHHMLTSVSVVTETCMEADGLATALMVLGPQDAYNYAEEHDLAVLLIVREGDKFLERMTPKFQQFLSGE